MPTAAPTQSHDVAVLGGGIIGLSVAWRAAQRGLSVVLVDRGALGAAASGVAAGMLAPVAEADANEEALLKLGLVSAGAWSTFAQQLAEAAGVDGVGYRQVGTLVLARDRDEAEALDREVALRAGLGIAVEKVLPSAARDLEPALAPTLRAAFHAPDDHAVDPRAVTAALARACFEAGVVLRPRTAVAAVEPTGPRPGVRLVSGERVAAGTIVVAAGAWSGDIAGLEPVPVRPVKGQLVRLRDPSGAHLLQHVLRYPGGYLVPRADGRVMVGATQEERGFDTAITALGVYELLRDAAELVPGILELELEETVAGLRPGTPDNLPILGAGEDGVVWATGHHRGGVLLTPLTAELVVGELTGVPIAPELGPGRFTRTGVPA